MNNIVMLRNLVCWNYYMRRQENSVAGGRGLRGGLDNVIMILVQVSFLFTTI